MVKRIVLLLVLSLVMATTAQANLLTNGDFEEGNPLGEFLGVVGGYAPDGWEMITAGAGWHQNNPDEVLKDLMSIVFWGTGELAQDFDVTSGTTYEYSVEVINITIAGHLESTVGSLVMYAEAYDAGDTAIAEDVEIDRYECGVDPVEEWVTISGLYTAPSGAAYCRIYFVFEGASGLTHISYDNASVVALENPFAASNPTPGNATTQDPAVVNAGDLEFDLPDTPTITGIDYDLYWQVDDANDSNWGSAAASDTGASAGDHITVTLPETITAEHTYYWRVDVDITSTNPAEEGIQTGYVWWFTTVNAPPKVDAGGPIAQNAWLDGGGSAVVSLDGSVTDDGLPVPPGTLTIGWSSDPSAGVSFNPPNPDNAVTDVTFTIAGDYTLTLSGNDGSGAVTDDIYVRVLANGYEGLVALYDFEGDAEDSSGSGHHGTLSTTNTEEPNLPEIDDLDAQVGDESLLLFKVGQRVHIADSGVADPNWDTESDDYNISAYWADMQATDQVTFSAWIKVAEGELLPWVPIVFKGEAYASVRYAEDRFGYAAVGSWNDNDPNAPIGAFDNDAISIALDTGQWHHVAGTYDGGAVRYYVDGVLEAKTDDADSIYRNRMPIGGGYLQIGGGLNGRIDQARIHDVALSDEMIMAQFVADGGSNTCRQQYTDSDINQDCYTNLTDFAILALDWLDCSDLSNPLCTQ